MSSSAITGSATVRTPKVLCKVCGQVEMVKACSQCHIVSYCSRPCQEKDWPTHKGECRASAKSASSSSSKAVTVAHNVGVSSSTSPPASSSSSSSPAKVAVAGTSPSSTSSSSSSSSSSAADSSTSHTSCIRQYQNEIEGLPHGDLIRFRTQHIVGHPDIIFVVKDASNLDILSQLGSLLPTLDIALAGILDAWAENKPNVSLIRLIKNHTFSLADALNKIDPSSILVVFVNNHSSASDDLTRLAQEAVKKREAAEAILPGSEHDPKWFDFPPPDKK